MRIDGKEIYLRPFEMSDAEALFELQIRNRELFQRTAPTQPENFYTLECQQDYIKNGIEQQENGQRFGFGIFLKQSDQLIGNIMIANIRRGPSQSCIMGYSLDQAYNGRGYTTEAVSYVLNFAFHELKLHRVEAGVMPSNTGSIRVLEKSGFTREGLSRENLEINGKRESHYMFSKLVTDL